MERTSRGGTVLHYYLVENSQKPVVVMVHHMWGNHKTFRRHVKLFNDNGYSCVTFNLFQSSTITTEHSYTRKDHFRFIYSNWIRQISDVLDSVPERKVILSMSGPSLAGLIAASERTDIVAYICDGGPFKEFWTCTYRMFYREQQITNPIKCFLWTTLACLYWGPLAFRHLQRALKKWDSKMDVLSIRGGSDPIVFPQNIENVFKNHHHINMHVHTIKNGQHLDGLKNFPEEYSQAVLSFLDGKKNISLA